MLNLFRKIVLNYMSKVIIGIHGLGNKPPKEVLEDWWKKSMIEGLRRIGKGTALPKFEMVYWADVIYKKPLNEMLTDKNHPLYLDEKYAAISREFQNEDHGIRKKIISFLGRQLNKLFLNEDYTLNFSVISDAIIHLYFNDLEIYYNKNCENPANLNCRAKTIIRERVAEVIEKYRRHKIFLIAHSMGSIVAYDTITFLKPKIKIHTFATIGSPLGLPAVIGKIAAEMKDFMGRDGFIGTPPGVVKNWYNFSDILDKIALNYKLSDIYSENAMGIKPVDFLVTNDYMMQGCRNPHKSFGYLRAPEFSEILYGFIKTEKRKVGRRVARSINSLLSRIQVASKYLGRKRIIQTFNNYYFKK